MVHNISLLNCLNLNLVGRQKGILHIGMHLLDTSFMKIIEPKSNIRLSWMKVVQFRWTFVDVKLQLGAFKLISPEGMHQEWVSLCESYILCAHCSFSQQVLYSPQSDLCVSIFEMQTFGVDGGTPWKYSLYFSIIPVFPLCFTNKTPVLFKNRGSS